MVIETTLNVSEHTRKTEEVVASQSAAVAAEYDRVELDLDMSTHGSVDLMDHGDAHTPDQHILVSEMETDQSVTEPDVSVDKDDTVSVQVEEDPRDRIAEEDTSVKSIDEDVSSKPALRKSARVRKKPAWQEGGDYCMSVTSKSQILQSLLSPSTLSQLHPDVIYAVVKGISDTC